MTVSNVTTFVIENTCALVAEAAAFVDLASFGLAYSLAMGYFFAEIYFWNVILKVKNSEFWDLIVNFTLVKKSVIKILRLFKIKNQHWFTKGSRKSAKWGRKDELILGPYKKVNMEMHSTLTFNPIYKNACKLKKLISSPSLTWLSLRAGSCCAHCWTVLGALSSEPACDIPYDEPWLWLTWLRVANHLIKKWFQIFD